MPVSQKPRAHKTTDHRLVERVQQRWSGCNKILAFLSRGTSVQAPDPATNPRPLQIVTAKYGL